MILPTQVVFNADDFGLSASVNRAVIDAHRNGLLTSASLMANMPGFEEAAGLTRENPSLGVGVHLNCLRGAPILPAKSAPSITNGSGDFIGNFRELAWQIYKNRVDIKEIEAEWQAQIDKVKEAGIKPTHIDSEKHMHLIFPKLTIAVAKLALNNGIRVVRTIREPFYKQPLSRRFGLQSWKCRFLNYRSRMARRLLQHLHLDTPSFFYGVMATGSMTVPYVSRLLTHMFPGVTEMMFHPSVAGTDGAFSDSFLKAQREMEYKTLCNARLKDLCAERSIEIINYGAIAA